MKKFYLSHNRQGVSCVTYACALLGLAKVSLRVSSRQCSRGFSLLELVVVIALLSIVALSATTLIIDNGDLKRQQETEARWNAIHSAILGDQSLSVAGEPYMDGYVSDMGRLPTNLQELFIQGDQPDWDEYELYKQAAGVNCSTTPEQCYWLGAGWRGPYLYTAGMSEYRDAWNNIDDATRADGGSVDDDALNFGWVFTATGTPATDISLLSLGFDNRLGGAEYNQDFPVTGNLIDEAEWSNPASSMQFNIQFNKPLTADVTFYIRLSYFSDDNNSATPPVITNEDSAGSYTIANGNISGSAILNLTNDLPKGRYALVLYCDSGFSQVFDQASGTCDTNNDTSPFYFNLMPNMTIVKVEWNLN